jgi:hypothetical protein
MPQETVPVIDTHQHLGRSRFSGVTTTEDDLVAAMDRHHVATALVMPQPTLEDVRAVHDRIAEAAARHPGRIAGIASVDPWGTDEEYAAEVTRCVRDLGFVAIKLHPLGHGIAPNHPAADKVFAAATRLEVPVIVHTGLGAPFALPALCIPPARAYPDVPVVLAHAGWGLYSQEAVVAAEVCANIYLEPSWCPSFSLEHMVRAIGVERLLFGSDHLSNLSVELAKFHAIQLSDDELRTIFQTTPTRLFKLEAGP